MDPAAACRSSTYGWHQSGERAIDSWGGSERLPMMAWRAGRPAAVLMRAAPCCGGKRGAGRCSPCCPAACCWLCSHHRLPPSAPGRASHAPPWGCPAGSSSTPAAGGEGGWGCDGCTHRSGSATRQLGALLTLPPPGSSAFCPPQSCRVPIRPLCHRPPARAPGCHAAGAAQR